MSSFNPREVHLSDIRSFRACRRKWNWSSRIRQNLERITPYAPFFTGKAVHAALEFLYRDAKTLEETLTEYFDKELANLEQLGELWPIEQTQFEDEADLVVSLMHHYQLWQDADKTKYSDSNLEFVDMEVAFELPLYEDIIYGGRLDGVVRHKDTGEIWIFETKTARSIDQLVNNLITDEQSTAYIWAARQLYPDDVVAGVLFNVIRKKTPAVPTLLQRGTLSKASIDTTTYYYKYCVRTHFPDYSDETIEEEYGDALEKFDDRKFFMRYPVYRTQDHIDLTMQGIIDTAKEMLNPDIATYPNPSWSTCGFCLFKSPCIAMNSGANYKALLDAEFQLRESATSMRGDSDEES